jgi:hypothetical protein
MPPKKDRFVARPAQAELVEYLRTNPLTKILPV